MNLNTQSSAFSLDKYTEDGLLSTVLRYGLFVGAIFQLFCIASAILLPAPADPSDLSEADNNEENKHGNNNGNDNMSRRLHKLRKQEKKKRH